MRREPEPLGEFEQMVLLAVLRSGAQAYGVTVYDELQRHAHRRVARGAVYMTLDRLETKGLLHSWTGEPTAQRGGRRRKFYGLRPAGLAAMRQAYRAFQSMADGLQDRLGAK